MKKLYENQKYSLYYLQEKLGLSLDALYKYARGEYNISNMPIKMVLDIAKIEGIEPNILYDEMLRYKAIKMSNKRGKNE